MRLAIDFRYALHESFRNDELVGPENIDLKTEYRRLNLALYGGQLGTYPIQWSNRKHVLARVLSRGQRGRPETYAVQRIEVSKLYEMTYQQFLNRLAHEMIHVFIIESGKADVGGYHGMRFQDEVRRINGLGGYQISTKEDLPAGTKLRSRKVKKLVAILFDRGASKTALVTAESAWQSVLEQLAGFSPRWLEQYSIFFVLSDHVDLQGMPTKRKISRKGRFQTYFLPDGVWEQIRHDGKLLASIVQGKQA